MSKSNKTKICKSCGSYYSGDYCEKCGWGNPDIKSRTAEKYHKSTVPKKFRNAEQQAIAKQWDDERKSRHDPNAKIKLLITAIVVALGLVIYALYSQGLIFSNTKESVIKDYFESVQNGDFDKFVDCFPKEIKQEYQQDRVNGNYSKEECMNEILFKDFRDTYGDDYTIKVKFGKQKKLSASDYDMTEYKKSYGTVPKISEVYEILTTVTLKGSKASDEVHLYISVGKSGGKWRIFNLSQQ